MSWSGAQVACAVTLDLLNAHAARAGWPAVPWPAGLPPRAVWADSLAAVQQAWPLAAGAPAAGVSPVLARASAALAVPLGQPCPAALFAAPPQPGAQADAHWRDWLDKAQAVLAAPLPLARQLDDLDTLCQLWLHALPADAAGEVALCDAVKMQTALCTAHWLHAQSPAADGPPLWVVQGDFFGIQPFIFAEGADTQRHAAKLLRGRSFQVALWCELAAARVLLDCGLPPGSQILNAAGKFLLVAPNTPAVRQALANCQQQFDQDLLRHTLGMVSVGLAATPAELGDFAGPAWAHLLGRLEAAQARAKLQRFALIEQTAAVLPAEYPHGPCRYQQHLPAEASGEAALSRDQVALGRELLHLTQLILSDERAATPPAQAGRLTRLDVTLFGLQVWLARPGGEYTAWPWLRCWDLRLPASPDAPLWGGQARRSLNAYAPRLTQADCENHDGRYVLPPTQEGDFAAGQLKTFWHLACDDREPDGAGGWRGQRGLMAVKGDVDNLGKLFRSQPGVAHSMALSRELHQFFAVWLPAHCAVHAPNMYTVFAGGDDFFLIGPWRAAQTLLEDMRQAFARYAGQRPDVHFSAGLSLCAPSWPVRALANQAEAALASAKTEKNAVSVFGQTLPWALWPRALDAERQLAEAANDYRLGQSFWHALLSLLALAHQNPPRVESAMWRSKLTYRLSRQLDAVLPPEQRPAALARLAEQLGARGIAPVAEGGLGAGFCIPLFNYLYRQR